MEVLGISSLTVGGQFYRESVSCGDRVEFQVGRRGNKVLGKVGQRRSRWGGDCRLELRACAL